MKYMLSIISLSSFLLLTSAELSAGDRDKSYYSDYARVTHVEPIYTHTRYQPRDCYRDNYDNRRSHTSRRHFSENTATIGGAIIGGVIGNQFGGGKGKTAMTIAGTVLGGSIAKDSYRQKPLGYSRDNHRYKDECRYSNNRSGYRGYDRQRKIDGYRVSYRYNGQVFTTTMDHDPGRRVPIEISVRPSNNRYNNHW